MKVEESFQANQLLHSTIGCGVRMKEQNGEIVTSPFTFIPNATPFRPLRRCKSAAEMEQPDKIYSISR